MCLQVEVPAFAHRDAPVDNSAVSWIAELDTGANFVLCVHVIHFCRVESSVVTLADNDYAYLWWWRRGFVAIDVSTDSLNLSQLEAQYCLLLTFRNSIAIDEYIFRKRITVFVEIKTQTLLNQGTNV